MYMHVRDFCYNSFMKKITPCLWFDDNAEEAVNYYVSIFKNSTINSASRYDEASAKVAQRPAGSVMMMTFTLDGNDFLALNGGPVFKLSEAVSFMIPCKDQAEIDFFWEKLTDGGEEQPCGWMKDKFGLSWQLIPDGFKEMMGSGNPTKMKNVMGALMQMKKPILADLEAAYNKE